ncbi:succinylglutamate desuccinylase/aspartoacylase family protein [Dactylosporangium sucinum]|uniref:Deacylase n=1 Tax=Dactylosporangium sucinum TaxID=1424081 RepID=A0A917WYK6_9ACTN|nr:succinylglutamate desuccinylase/aspartoacylase family protein [Dactylosporangium sucinum]GGM40284.1 deacylase [Dactylosporangium sucinum]
MTHTSSEPAAPALKSPKELLDIDKASHAQFRLPVARRASGEDLSIRVHVAKGASDGPTLGLVAAVHGDAVFGSHIIRLAMQRLDLTNLRGTVVAVPVANPVAFESGTRTTGQGWNTDMNNMNRVFPGSAEGWISQQMAAALSENVIGQLDALIDYHCGADTSINYTLIDGDKTQDAQRNIDFNRLMATDFIYTHDVNPFSGTITGHARGLGILSVVAEQGGNILPPGFDELSLTRIENYLKALGMIDGEPVLPDTQLVMSGGRTLQRIRHGGLFYPEVGIEGLSAVVEGGTVLSRVVDPHSFEVLQEIRAPYEKSAIFQTRPGFGQVNPGDYAYIIGDATKAVEIERLSSWRFEL